MGIEPTFLFADKVTGIIHYTTLLNSPQGDYLIINSGDDIDITSFLINHKEEFRNNNITKKSSTTFEKLYIQLMILNNSKSK